MSASASGELRYVVAPITNVEVRDPTGTDDNTWTMSGYAAVFNETTTLYNGKFLRLTESIDPGFFNRVLRDQPMGSPTGVVHYNLGHDMNRAVAATDVPAGEPGSLQLRADERGLFFLAKVSRDDPDGVAMAAKMRTGVVKQASFAFTVASDRVDITENEDGPDTEHRTLLEAGHLYDVCACPQGAYSQTESGLRSYGAALGQPAREATPVSPELLDNIEEAGSLSAPEQGGGESTSTGSQIRLDYRIRRLRKLKEKLNG